MEQSTASELVFNRATATFPGLTQQGRFFLCNLIMQKVFNLLGATAFLMSGAMVAGSLMLYTRIPSLTKYYMSELKLELTKVVADMIPAVNDVMPELPSATGPAIETPKLPF